MEPKTETKSLGFLEQKLMKIRELRLAQKREYELIERARERIKDLEREKEILEQQAQSLAQYKIPLGTPAG